ncbi:alpha/beta hydrolase [Legionella londiniensis]|uniref:Carboxylesterase/phospholipase n=1 Tax=Legionella londiniensis TaxID=45068 RepID=A0A0W0VT58_9GAMM|nr:carboxylesterase/phospholipase [Legionella londiniensis]STX94130.1 carboxylesterase/phospholipase [Legionella londiniensis]
MNTYKIDSRMPAQICIIWLHGLGADAQDMMGLARELPLSFGIRHVFIDAPIRPVTLNGGMPMRAWYDIASLAERDQADKAGIFESQDAITRIMQKQYEEGFSARQIILAGFSQGGAMALFTALQHEEALGGIIALSAYLPQASEIRFKQDRDIPVFMAAGQFDTVVSPVWTKKSADRLREMEYSHIAFHEYPMEHSICAEEIVDLTRWLTDNYSSFK